MSEYNRHKWAMEWMHGGGRDPNGRSLDDEIKIGKEDWMERQRVAQGGRIGLQSGQLVQPGPGRQGYQGAHDKGAGERLREEITEATNKKYADIVKEKKIKGKYSDITDAKVKSQIRSLHISRHVTPYEKKGFIRSKELIESNFKNFDKFSKSGQSIDDFYALFKDKTFKLNLRDYLKGRAGSGITKAFDDLSFKTKYEKIIPKLTKHLEVWHEREPDPGKTKLKAKKRALIKKYSSYEVEKLINQAKRVNLKDYMNQVDLSHRQQLNMNLNLSELGIEKPEINQVLIKSAERERNKLQSKNIKLIDEIKQGKNVQKSMELIAQNNDRIKAIAKMTNGRLLGVTMDLETLKPVKINPSSVSSVDANLWNKPIKEFAKDQKAMLEFKNKVLPQIIEEARAMTPEKIAVELSGIMQDEVLSKKLAADIEKLAPDKSGSYPLKAKSQEVYKIMQGAGFPIDQCFLKAKGGPANPDDCIRGVVNETIAKAKRGDADAIKIFKNQKQVLKQTVKRGTGLGSKLTWFLGPIDAPLELAFALPHLLMGDYEAAKRATTGGLTGWGKVDLDNVDNPEARKYLKHKRDTDDWINNWQKHDYYTNKLENLPDDASDALRNDIEARINKRASNMDSIAQTYDGYDRSGSENEYWAYNPEEIAGKKAARNWIDTKVETDLERGLDATYRKQETPVGEIDISGYRDEAREKLRASPTDLESFIKTKGQDFYGDPEGWFFYNPLKQEEAEAHGVGDIYDNYYMGADEGKDIRDSYSSIPLEYASQLGAMEAKETREGLEAIRKSQPNYGMYYAEGGIASLKKK